VSDERPVPQRATGEATRGGEERLRRLMEVSSDGLWEWDLASNSVWWSSQLHSVLAYPADAFPGSFAFIQEITHPEDRRDFRAAIDAHLSGGAPYDTKVRLRAGTGDYRVCRVWGTSLRDPAGRPTRMVGALRDVSAQDEAEAALRRSEARYRTLTEQFPNGSVIVVDRDFVVTIAAGQELAALGLTPDLLRGRRLVELEMPERALLVPDRRGTVLGGRPITFEVPFHDQIYLCSAAPLPDERGEGVNEILIVSQNVTASQRQLRLMAQTQHAAEIGGWELDCRSMALYWTDETYRIHDLAPGQYSPTVETAIAFYAPDSMPIIAEAVRAAIDHGRPFDLELRLTTAMRRTIWVRSVGRAERHNDVTLKIFGSIQNVTPRKQLEGQLLLSQKMEGIGRLAGGIAHDFSNLMTAILGQIELAEDAVPDGSQARASLEVIRTAANRAVGVTQQLLTFSRRQPQSSRVIDLNALTRSMKGMLAPMLGEDIELVTHLAEDLHPVRADPTQIEQVIMNLAVNARDAMPGGGHLVLRTSNVEVGEAEARRRGLDPVAHVLLQVSDTGRGMSADALSHAFEPFFTTKAPGTGTGLGLSTCYAVVRQNHGSIDIESTVDVGTTVNVLLPAAVGRSLDAPEPVERRSPRGSETILLVEDDSLVRDMSARALTSMGYQVISAGNGQEAIVAAARHEGRIDLLLTDVIMPGMDGGQVSQEVARMRPGIRVLFMSGYAEDVVTGRQLVPPRSTLLPKPFTPAVLGAKVREVLDR
jgi:PAS domain S-box-containing protein